jgi:hypothetical protein
VTLLDEAMMSSLAYRALLFVVVSYFTNPLSFFCLCSCAEYVKHLVKTNQEKEEAVKKARCDLEAKRQKMEDDKAQQDPSDPESTTSSLTLSSSSNKDAMASGEDNDKMQDDVNNKREGTEIGEDVSRVAKKPRLESAESNLSMSSSSGTGEKGIDGVNMVKFDQAVSSVSDMTDSNKGSSESKSDDTQSNNVNETYTQAESRTVESDAAIVYGQDNASAIETHSDIVVHGRKRSARVSKGFDSLGRTFQLDYEEVFLRSNVPQLLATPQGRIIACKLSLAGVSVCLLTCALVSDYEFGFITNH